MKIIDFHTHIFPEKIASRTIEKLEHSGNIKAFTNGMLNGLKESMEKAEVDISVVLPVVTNPNHITTVNKVAYETNENWEKTGIMSFGGIHPDNENYIDELKVISEYGLKGIKLHPDYQNVFFNDIRYKRIIYKASELGLIISVHAGLDIGLPEPIHCTPDMAAEVIEEIKPNKLVLAHMGGMNLWDEAEKELINKNIYLDTACCLDKMPQEQFLRFINGFGGNRILFATDSPWAGQKEYVNIINEVIKNEDVKNQILYKNAEKLLDI